MNDQTDNRQTITTNKQKGKTIMTSKTESEAEKQVLDTCEIILALAAYQEGGTDRATIIHRIREFAGVTIEQAARYCEAFEEDGICAWRYKAIESVMRTISRNDKRQSTITTNGKGKQS